MSESIYAPDGGLIMSVVYDLDMHPFSVNVRPKAGAVDTYDFAWCKRDACCYHHLSGGGNVPYLEGSPRFLTQAGSGWIGTGKRRRLRYHYHRARTRVWLDPSVESVCVAGGRRHSRDIDREGLRREGWLLLSRPPTNPFDDSEGDSAHWCVFCEDDLPEENLCEHLDWCNRCGGFVYVKTDPGIAVPSHETRCRHRRRT